MQGSVGKVPQRCVAYRLRYQLQREWQRCFRRRPCAAFKEVKAGRKEGLLLGA